MAPHRAEQRVLITLCKCDISTKTGGRFKSSVSRPRTRLRDVKGAIPTRDWCGSEQGSVSIVRAMTANGPGSASTEQPDPEAFVSDDRANRHVHRAECQSVAMLDPPVFAHHADMERAPPPIGAAPL